MFRHLFLQLAVFAGSAFGAVELEFCAYLRVDGREMFVLGNPVTGKSSDWLQIGQSFSGYSITRFDAKSESLTVTSDGHPLTIFLSSGVNRHSDRENAQGGTFSSRLEMAKSVLKSMRMRYREAHPRVKAQLAHIAELERRVAEEHAKR